MLSFVADAFAFFFCFLEILNIFSELSVSCLLKESIANSSVWHSMVCWTQWCITFTCSFICLFLHLIFLLLLLWSCSCSCIVYQIASACKWLVYYSLHWFRWTKWKTVDAFNHLQSKHSSFQHRRVIYANKYICQICFAATGK